jgi:hypothetical protein
MHAPALESIFNCIASQMRNLQMARVFSSIVFRIDNFFILWLGSHVILRRHVENVIEIFRQM